jgi:hypothetical protein
MSDAVYTERADTGVATRDSANGQKTDWSGWENWLRGHLDIERQTILDAVVETVGDLEAKTRPPTPRA